MKIYFLGTCAGTEPMPNRKHTSFAIESNDRIYWFDAGEGCSYTAHLLGLDLLKVEKIVISHPHIDHVGGLANLLWTIRKISLMKKELPKYNGNQVYMPCMETWEGVMLILRSSEMGFETNYPITASPVTAGALFDDGIMKVVAYPNTHLSRYNLPTDMSFSFLIQCEGKKLVYSGDVGKYEDLDCLIGGGCDGLIIETGHFGISRAYEYCKNKNIGKLFFNHSGREILNNLAAAKMKVSDLFGDKATICQDGMSIEF